MEIGERIKTLRELRGLTQTELALAMGYKDKSTICKIEANQRDLPRSKVAAAAEVLGVEPGYLVGWEADQDSFDLQLLAVPAETEELWAEYEATYGDRWPTNTRRAKMQSWGVLEPYADMDINRINVTMYEVLFRSSGLNKPKLRQAKSLINLLYDFAVKKQYTTPDYAAFIRYIEIDAGNPNTLPHKRIPREVIAELWTRSDDINVQCILFMIYTGVRISEFVSIKPEDVERDAKIFTVRESKTAAGKNRRVPIADKVLPIVDGWLSLGYKHIAPYPNIWRQSSPDGAFRYSFKKALPEYSPHDTRYTCVSELTEAGAPAAVIRSIVGHKDANVTARYTQISDDIKLQWINALEI